jgi:alkylation response protein AidB-like acyl-CoA dehydrogenase
VEEEAVPLTVFDLRVADVALSGKDFGVDFIAQARALLPELEGSAAEIDAKRDIPPGIIHRLVEHGFFRMTLPKFVGGAEVDHATFLQVLETLATADASTPWILGQAAGCALSAAYLDAATAQEVFGDRRAVLIWGPPEQAKAIQCEGGYRLTGKWSFGSGVRHATWIGAHAPVFEADGVTRALDARGEPLVVTCIVPAAKVRLVDVWHTLGLKGTGSDNYEISDVFVPARFSYWRDDSQRKYDGPLYRFPLNTIHAIAFAAVSLGLARRILDSFLEVARVKVPRLQKAAARLRENNSVQAEVGLAEAKLRSSRLYLLEALEGIWREVERTHRVTLDQRMVIRLAATYAIRQSKEVVDMAYHHAGALAVLAANPFERRFRDMHTVMQQVQARHQHFENVGQYILGLEPDLTLI